MFRRKEFLDLAEPAVDFGAVSVYTWIVKILKIEKTNGSGGRKQKQIWINEKSLGGLKTSSTSDFENRKAKN